MLISNKPISPYFVADLYFFGVTARHGSFSRAADELNVSQAAVSQRIRQLEDLIGEALFHRHARGVSLTPLGQDWNAAVSEGFTMVTERVQTLMQRGQSMQLSVSCSPSLAMDWLVPRLRRFYERFPEIDLSIVAESQAPSVEQMQRTGIDIAIRYDPQLDYPDLHCENICQEWIMPVAAPHKMPPRQDSEALEIFLKQLPLVHDAEAWQGSPTTYEWDTWLAHNKIKYDTSVNSRFYNLSHLAISAARQGDGLAIVRVLTALDMLKRQELVSLKGKPIPSGIWYRFITPIKGELSAPAAAFKEWIFEEFQVSQSQLNEYLE
jgi:DNA-binding transcriptional LysR family regulator